MSDTTPIPPASEREREAFEDAYQADSRDPSMAEDLRHFLTGYRAALSHPSTPQPTCNVGHANFTPFYLLSNLRRIASAEYRRKPNWALALELFAVGSTTAHRICRDAEIDPDAFEVRRPPPPEQGGKG